MTRIIHFFSDLFILMLVPSLLSGQTRIDDDGLLFFAPELTGKLSRTETSRAVETGEQYIQVSQLELHKILPFFPVIFFDDPGETAIPQRYKLLRNSSETAGFTGTLQLGPGESSIEVYRDILNVIGHRMKTHPEHLYLTGCYTSDPGESGEVGLRRAEAVQSYLHMVWSVPSDDISLREPRLLGTSSDEEITREEGRAVWMEFEQGDIISPLIYTVKHNRSVIVPLELQLRPNMNCEKIVSFEIRAWLDGELVSSVAIPKGYDTAAYTFYGEWQIPFSRLCLLPSGFRISIDVIDVRGNRRTSNILTLPFRQNPSRPGEQPSQLYHMLWDMIPLSVYHTDQLKLELTDMLEASVRQTSRGWLDLRVNLPHEPGESDLYTERSGRSLCEITDEVVVNVKDLSSPPEEESLEGGLIEELSEQAWSGSRSSCVFGISFDEAREKRNREEEANNDNIWKILNREAELYRVKFHEAESTMELLQRGTSLVRYVRDYLKAMRENEEPGMINPRSLGDVLIRARTSLALFPPSTPEERCYNRSVQVSFE